MMKLGAGLMMMYLLLHGSIANAQSYQVKSFDEVEQFLADTGDGLYVINFWATWCKPCIAELPHFEQLNAERNDVHVLLISLDGEPYWEKSLKPFLEKNQVKSKVWVMNNKRPVDWIDRIDPRWQGSIPGTLFLNKNKGIKQFEEHEFTYEQLTQMIDSFNNN